MPTEPEPEPEPEPGPGPGPGPEPEPGTAVPCGYVGFEVEGAVATPSTITG